MSVRTANWYAARSRQLYPLDGNATGVSDAGEKLPHDILVDCTLNWDPAYGQYAFVSSVTVTDKIISIIISATNSITTVTGFTPLAVVTVKQPVTAFTHYPIEALQSNVGGFVVFGDVNEPFSGRFSTPAQGLLCPSCAAPAHGLPIPTVKKKGVGTTLKGIVQLQGTGEIEVVTDQLLINNEETPVIAFRLKAGTDVKNPLRDFIGPCGARPESENCIEPGIQAINEITPDENGNINIVFVDALEGPYDGCDREAAGITLDQELGLADVCVPNDYGKFSGQGYCELITFDSESSSSSSSDSSGFSSVSGCDIVLPFTEDWETGDAGVFFVQAGTFENSLYAGSRVYAATNTAVRNIALADLCNVYPLYDKEVSVEFSIPNASSRNAMLVLNHRTVYSGGAHIEYFGLEVDHDLGVLRLLRFNGVVLVTDYSVPLVSGLVLNDTYRLHARIEFASVTLTGLYLTIEGVTDTGWPSVSFSLLTPNYITGGPGYFGVASYCSPARFDNFTVTEITP